MGDLKKARRVLGELLQDGTPELGARLKQRMTVEFIRRGYGKFDQRLWGYPKFVDFLESNGDVLMIERSDGPGDLTVSLRPGAQVDDSVPAPKPSIRDGRIRNDLWQAFTNPDPQRRRYYHVTSGAVRHYLDGEEDSLARHAVESSPEEYVKIPSIPGEMHIAWMREYLEALNLPEQERIPLARMLDGTYSSKLNAAFTGALGEHSMGWRRRRTRRVLELVQSWAKEHGIPERVLEVPLPEPTGPALPTKSRKMGDLTNRQRLSALIDLLPDSDLDEVVLPFVLSVLWTSMRRR